MNKHILLVEDSEKNFKPITEELEAAGFRVTQVTRLPLHPTEIGFRDLLEQASTFDLVIWDGVMAIAGKTAHQVNTATDGFITAFKTVFSGPMIANSSVAGFRIMQMKAGCTHTVSRQTFGCPEAIELAKRLLA